MSDRPQGPFREGQTVRATFDGRVVKVVYTGRAEEVAGLHIIRSDTGFREYLYVDEGISIEVLEEPAPTEPGVYWARTTDREDEEYGFDGRRFYYLNEKGNWCDMGWGHPDRTEVLVPYARGPF